jgi:hypothetical protein
MAERDQLGIPGLLRSSRTRWDAEPFGRLNFCASGVAVVKFCARWDSGPFGHCVKEVGNG